MTYTSFCVHYIDMNCVCRSRTHPACSSADAATFYMLQLGVGGGLAHPGDTWTWNRCSYGRQCAVYSQAGLTLRHRSDRSYTRTQRWKVRFLPQNKQQTAVGIWRCQKITILHNLCDVLTSTSSKMAPLSVSVTLHGSHWVPSFANTGMG